MENNSQEGAIRHSRKWRLSKSTSVFEIHTVIHHTYVPDDDDDDNLIHPTINKSEKNYRN